MVVTVDESDSMMALSLRKKHTATLLTEPLPGPSVNQNNRKSLLRSWASPRSSRLIPGALDGAVGAADLSWKVARHRGCVQVVKGVFIGRVKGFYEMELMSPSDLQPLPPGGTCLPPTLHRHL